MSTKKQAIRGVMFNWLGRICSFAITFVLTPIIILGLGREYYGVWAIVMSLGDYYAISDLGMYTASVKYISQFAATGDQTSRNKIIFTSLIAYGCVGILVILVAAVMTWAFPLVFQLSEVSVYEARWAVFLTGVMVGLRMLGNVPDSIINGYKRFDYVNVLLVSAQLIQAIGMIAVVKADLGLIAMAIVALSVSIAKQLVQAVIALRITGPLVVPRPLFDRSSFRLLFRFSVFDTIRNMSRQVVSYTGPALVGFTLGPATVPFFTVANSLVTKSTKLTRGISSVVLPVASELHALERKSALSSMLIHVTRMHMALTMVFISLFIVLGREILYYWIDASFARESYRLLCILSLSMAVQKISGGLPTLLSGCNKLGVVTTMSVLKAIAIVSLAVALVPTIGVDGFGWAILIPTAMVFGIAMPLYACRVFEVPYSRFLLRGVLPPILAVIPAVLAHFLLAEVFPVRSLFALLAHATLFGGITAACTFWFCFDRQLRSDIATALVPKRFRGLFALAR